MSSTARSTQPLRLETHRITWSVPVGPFTNQTERTVLRISLRDSAGRTGVGEAAPLPGYSPDELPEVERAFAKLEVSEEACFGLSELRSCVDGVSERLPSARFALETALLDLLGQREERPVWRILGDWAELGGEVRSVPLARVVTQNDARDGEVVKLKIGRGDPREEAALVSSLGRANPSGELRLDAGARPLGEPLVEEMKRTSFSFLEEPPASLRDGPFPVALDESLALGDAKARIESALTLTAVVLKPTTLGGVLRCLDLVRLADARGAYGVVSHCLEGEVGWAACAHLAIAQSASGVAAGLTPTFNFNNLPMMSRGRLVPNSASGLGLEPGTNEPS